VNYRHEFHAGNFADVHKHVVLLALLERLQRKPKPLLYLDTHAGRGWYDLTSPDATRGNEWTNGVARLKGFAPVAEDLRRYVTALGASGSGAKRYPGSPVLAVQGMREGDRSVLVEQQIAEAHALEQSVRGRRGVSVICGDGYAALGSHLPPRENRGLVLIDPPYESENEYRQVAAAFQRALQRWPNGTIALWYPIKAGSDAQRLRTTLRDSGLRKLLMLELSVKPADSPLGLNGSGMIVANPPWQFDREIEAAQDELQPILAAGAGGNARVEWLVPE
jgi:23S rRNA (adenine2030-N6)-methyltransferase